jgi:hypothetical protein
LAAIRVAAAVTGLAAIQLAQGGYGMGNMGGPGEDGSVSGGGGFSIGGPYGGLYGSGFTMGPQALLLRMTTAEIRRSVELHKEWVLLCSALALLLRW